MRCSQRCSLLLQLNLVCMFAAGHDAPPGGLPRLSVDRGHLSQSGSGPSVVHPVRINADGEFVSHSLSHRFNTSRSRRERRSLPAEVYYKLSYDGRTLTFNLTENQHLLSTEYVLERRSGGASRAERLQTEGNSCHLLGTVEAPGVKGRAAISTCKGLRGGFSLPEGHFFIEPAEKLSNDSAGTAEPHIVYPRYTEENFRRKRSLQSKQTPSPCGVQGLSFHSDWEYSAADAPSDFIQVQKEREEWEREQQTEEAQAQSRSQRSVSRERWVETMVVADSKLIEYHGSNNVESYIFTIMNMVAGIFHDASIGNAIHVILVRLILLQGEEKGLKIAHHADTTLSSFCAWQKNLNPQSDTHPAHHDLAVLITRKDICAGRNQPCETLGLSHLSGMCQPHRSCNINEDSGLPVAFTVAHEMGHSFGIHHDGQGNDCEVGGKHPFIMSRQLMYDSSPLTWSPCSKEYITHFLDRGWGFCLDDRPSKRDLTTPLARLGVRYTTHHQCQLQYGPNATFCAEVDNVCQILWCSVNGSCRSKLDSPIDGTRCGPDKWCISGECVIVGKLPETVNGGWGLWDKWSHCSRTCGTGVQSAERECNNPKPEFGGKYCTGERKRYRTCNTKPCENEKPSFREMLCSEFDTVPYHKQLYQWIPVINPINPCELHCRPVSDYFSEKMLDAVTDGTPCFMNNKSRNICVNGVCKEVGCDFGIDSNAVEDRCGVCLGDGTSCQTVYKTYDVQEGFGYVDVGVIPEGARDVLVREAEEAGNFLALRGVASDKYFLNGNFIIQWNGEYEAGGTTFYYERSGNMENLTAPGPTKQPVMLQLLFQEKNPGLKIEYTIKKSKVRENEVPEPVYSWRHGAWTDCSTTCGIGEQQKPVLCFEMDEGVVDESLCDPDSRPEDRHRKCKNMECPARWWVGGWQQCTETCESGGLRKRTVLCVRTVSGEERVLHPAECKHLLKPKPVVPCYRDVPCGQEWAVGNWQECPVTCGGAVRSRMVACTLTPKKNCDPSTKPRSKSLCALQSCSNSSLQRHLGLPPVHRRIYPEKTQPTKHPGSQSLATTSYIVVPTTATKETITSTPNYTLSPVVVDPEDHDPSVPVRKNKNGDRKVYHNKSSSHKKEIKSGVREEENVDTEEGSTEDGVLFSPGYDYILEDKTKQNEKIIDLDFFTTVMSLRTLFQTTTPKQKARPLTKPISSVPPTTALPFSLTSTDTCARTTHHLPNINTTLKTKPYRPWTQRVPVTTPMYKYGQGLSKTFHVKKPSRLKESQNQQPRSPQSSSTSDQSNLTAGEPVSMDVYWVVGNWSECSTTCGIGALWRTVVCSSENDEECANLKRPEPARTCHLQPCATWQTGSWSKCQENCGSVRRRHRDVQCVDSQSKRPLRPFHCQNVSSRPLSQLLCPHKPCMKWTVSPWGLCSGTCGEGIRKLLVFCPEPHRCSTSFRPNNTEVCSLKPCLRWKPDDWGECSVSCGEGQQQRAVRCVSAQDSAVVPNRFCEKISKPQTLRKCNIQECKTNSVCRKNTMSSRFCDKLKLLGRCTLRSVERQCCLTCRLLPGLDPS